MAPASRDRAALRCYCMLLLAAMVGHAATARTRAQRTGSSLPSSRPAARAHAASASASGRLKRGLYSISHTICSLLGPSGAGGRLAAAWGLVGAEASGLASADAAREEGREPVRDPGRDLRGRERAAGRCQGAVLVALRALGRGRDRRTDLCQAQIAPAAPAANSPSVSGWYMVRCIVGQGAGGRAICAPSTGGF